MKPVKLSGLDVGCAGSAASDAAVRADPEGPLVEPKGPLASSAFQSLL